MTAEILFKVEKIPKDSCSAGFGQDLECCVLDDYNSYIGYNASPSRICKCSKISKCKCCE